MPSNKVIIFKVRPTGWNNDYLDTSTTVNSPLGAFTWRTEDRKLTTPVDHEEITNIDRASDTNPVRTIAQAITQYLDIDDDNLAAFEVAKQLVEMIMPSAENTPKLPTLWDDELFKPDDPYF